MRRFGILAVLALMLAVPVATASQANAASPIYMKNVGTITISITTTNPATGGSIYAVHPGYAGTGAGFYAACGRSTVYWLPGQSVKVAKACSWNYPPTSQQQYSMKSV